MKEVTNIRQLEELIDKVIEEIAEEYDIDAELVGCIIKHYSWKMSGQLERRIIISEN